MDLKTEWAYKYTLMDNDMMDFGEKVSGMVKEEEYFQMVMYTQESILMVLSMEMGACKKQMKKVTNHYTQEAFKMIKFKGMVGKFYLMAQNILVSGLMIKKKGTVKISGVMVVSITVNSKMVKGMVMGYLHYLMAEYMTDNGKMEASTVKAHSTTWTEPK